MPVCVHNCSTEQLQLGGFHCKAVKVTLSERGKQDRSEGRQRDQVTKGRVRRRVDKRHTEKETEENGQRSINDSARAAPDDSSGFGARKQLQNHERRG